MGNVQDLIGEPNLLELVGGAMQERTLAFMRCCHYLKLAKDTQQYKFIADSWTEYVASIGLTRDKVTKMVRLAEIFMAIEKQLSSAETPKIGGMDEDRLIRDWLPLVLYNSESGVVENADSAIELLEQARELSHSDFQAVKDQYRQTGQRPDIEPALSEGPVLDEEKNVVGNYRTRKATGKQHYFAVSISDEHIRRCEGQSIKLTIEQLS